MFKKKVKEDTTKTDLLELRVKNLEAQAAMYRDQIKQLLPLRNITTGSSWVAATENRLVIVCQESDGTGSMLTLENDKLHFQKLIPIEKWIEGLKPIEVE